MYLRSEGDSKSNDFCRVKIIMTLTRILLLEGTYDSRYYLLEGSGSGV